MRSFATILLALSLPLHAFAAHVVNHAHRHAEVALRPRQGSGARMTYYDITTGLTACGHSHGSNDFVVALNPAQFGNVPGSSPMCGKAITITYNGKTANAVIDDKCPVCPYGGLDLTEGLFNFLAGGLGAGVIYADWTVGGGGGDAPAPAPTTSHTPPPPSPTTHYVPPTTTHQEPTTSPPPPSSSSSSTSTSTSKSSSDSSAPPSTSRSSTSHATQPSGVDYNNPPASSLAQPSGTIAPGQDQSINYLYQGIIGLGALVDALNS